MHTEPATLDPQTALVSLLRAMAARDEPALASFYDATAAKAYACALRICREAALAEEVVADVYWQIWQQAERYDPARGSVLAWVVAIARSRALDALRRCDRSELHAAPETLHLDAPLALDPQDILTAVERDTHLHRAIAQLSETQRHLLGLAFFKDLSHSEIATHTGLPLGSVKTHLRSALKILRRDLQYTSEDQPA